MEAINIVLSISIILNLILVCVFASYTDKIKSLNKANANLNKNFSRLVKALGTSKSKKLFDTLVWYGKKTYLYKVKYSAYEKALMRYHSLHRMNELPANFSNMSFAELCDWMVDRKILNRNYYRETLAEGYKEPDVSLHEILKTINRVNPEDAKPETTPTT